MASPIRQIELALIARLSIARSYKVRVESYGAQLDDDTFAWVRTLPAVWVTFDKISESKRVGRHLFKVTGSFEVLSAQRHLNENERRLASTDSGQAIGLYELIEDNKLLLANRSLGLAIQPFTPGELKPVMKGLAGRDAVAIYSQTFTTQWMEEIPDESVDGKTDLLTVGLNYLIKPGDDTVDTSDLVTLRESQS